MGSVVEALADPELILEKSATVGGISRRGNWRTSRSDGALGAIHFVEA